MRPMEKRASGAAWNAALDQAPYCSDKYQAITIKIDSEH